MFLGEVIDKPFHISVSIDGLNEDHKPVQILTQQMSKNRTRHLKCEKQSCDEIIVLHLGYLDYTHYIITVNFYGLESFHTRYNINELFFYVRNFNNSINCWY